MNPNLMIDVYHAQLALAGWSVGDIRGARRPLTGDGSGAGVFVCWRSDQCAT
jgi:hypothetical protein